MLRRGMVAGAVLLLAACGRGSPQMMSVMTPTPQLIAYDRVLKKVNELGFHVTHADTAAGVIEAERRADDGSGRDDLRIRVYPQGDVTKLDVTTARVLGASTEQPYERRVAATRQTTADANSIIRIFLQTHL